MVEFLDLPEAGTSNANNCNGNDSNDGDGASAKPSSSPASIFSEYCLDRGLKIMPGIRCDPVHTHPAPKTEDSLFDQCGQQPRDLCYHSARLCFADMDADDVADGARLLARLYREYTGKN